MNDFKVTETKSLTQKEWNKYQDDIKIVAYDIRRRVLNKDIDIMNLIKRWLITLDYEEFYERYNNVLKKKENNEGIHTSYEMD